MAQPTSRQELINYCKRKLGAPVLEINVADEQIDDLVDDAIQFFQERHFDGVGQVFLKYQLTQDDINRGRAPNGESPTAGIVTTTASTSINGTSITFNYKENSNFLQIPPSVIGITKIYHFDGTNTTTNNMFSVKYQLFLNDIYYWGSTEILTYAMTKTYLEDIDFLLTTQKQIRFNQRQDRLYLDIDWGSVRAGDYVIIDCYRALDPSDYTRVWNDSFLKMYLTSLIKKQWGQNLIKFQGVKLPGGVELNGRQIYDDAQKEIDVIMEKMSNTYELPPLDMIG
jgi:hypothetical protein